MGNVNKGFSMNEQEFKKLYENFKSTERFFNEIEWDDAINKWKNYRELIQQNEGLPIERWLKNDQAGYLPDFLDTKEQKFGHARIGNYEQVMIYLYTGKDAKRNGKYRDVYKDVDASHTFDSIEDIQADYSENISSLLKKIVSADTEESVYELERSPDYKSFTCKQILR